MCIFFIIRNYRKIAYPKTTFFFSFQIYSITKCQEFYKTFSFMKFYYTITI